MKSPRRKITVLFQVCKLILGHLIDKLAKKYGIDDLQSRAFRLWSHLVFILFTLLCTVLWYMWDLTNPMGQHLGVRVSEDGRIVSGNSSIPGLGKT